MASATRPAKAALLGLSVCLLFGAPLRAEEGEEAAWIAYNQDLLRQRLREPESARFRDMFVSRKAGVPVACGEVDAKDSSGAYVGYARFVGAGSVGVFLPWDVDDFERLWATFCR